MITVTEHITFMSGDEAAAMAAFGETRTYSVLHDSFKDNPNYVETFRDGKLVAVTVKVGEPNGYQYGMTITNPMVMAAFMEGAGL